jgi:dienelactone hydrolase
MARSLGHVLEVMGERTSAKLLERQEGALHVVRIVLFHHAQGQRDDVLSWAASLRDAGHRVDTPDLFEGRTFEKLEDGIAHRDELGLPTLIARAEKALDQLPAEIVYAGFSMGASTAHYFAVTRPGALGVLLMHGTAPAGSLGVAAWPSGLPGQLHRKFSDPLMDERGVDALAESSRFAGAQVEIFTYPGGGHLFADPQGPDYDPAAAALMLERELEFLSRLD